jgi:crotonobetainyl-CoA:carnitine CoA-transferase CaiB-like acyl-CoA transferase
MPVHPAVIDDLLQHRPAGSGHPLDVLHGFEARVSGRSVVAQIIRRHLTDLGARLAPADADAPVATAARVVVYREASRRAECPVTLTVSWDGGLGAGLVDERTVQAACGLMHVHGRRGGRPRPLGIDYASIAAGVLSVQALLAGLLARERRLDIGEAQTSVADAALLAVSQYLANATAPQDDDVVYRGGGEPPPFRSLEGVAFELEALDGEVWARFWAQLGVTGAQVGHAWRSFVFRYATADCPLPADLHVTTRSFPIDAIIAAASQTGASICVLRSHAQRIRELGLDDADRVAPVWKLTGLGSVGGALSDPEEGCALPLSGLSVIEAGRRIQAPLAGQLLQRLGARVTRIEPPGGDPLRWMAPLCRGTSARFRALNDAKEIVELNIKDPAGRERLLGLAAEADVFLHNWAPGKAAELGLDAQDFAARNPAVVYAYASAWGDALGDCPPLGTDFMVQAHAGLAQTLTAPAEQPAPSLMTLLDIMGGLVGVEGILAGLLRRQRNNRGQRVDTSLLSAATVLQADVLEAAARDDDADRIGGRPRWGPLDQPLCTPHGLLAITVCDRDQLDSLAVPCGLADRDVPDLQEQIVREFATRPARELALALKGAGIACVVVCEDLAQLADDAPFLSALRFDGCAFVRAPWRWSR